MKIKKTVALALLTLTGCSIYGSSKDRPNIVVVESKKNPRDYMMCLAPKFRRIWPHTEIASDESDYIITGTLRGTLRGIASIDSKPYGSQAKYMQLFDGKDLKFNKSREAVESCR